MPPQCLAKRQNTVKKLETVTAREKGSLTSSEYVCDNPFRSSKDLGIVVVARCAHSGGIKTVQSTFLFLKKAHTVDSKQQPSSLPNSASFFTSQFHGHSFTYQDFSSIISEECTVKLPIAHHARIVICLRAP